MILAVKSWRLREAARTAIGAGQFEQAFELAAIAQEMQRTTAGEVLRVVGGLLVGQRTAATIPYDRDRQE